MKQKPTNPAKVNWTNIKSYFQGHKRKIQELLGTLEPHVEEQAQWRASKAQACVDNGACLFCGCTFPEKLYSDIGCDDPYRRCYPVMKSKEDWEKFKLENDINID